MRTGWCGWGAAVVALSCSNLPPRALFRCEVAEPRCPRGLECRVIEGDAYCVSSAPTLGGGEAGEDAGGAAGGAAGGSAGGVAGESAGGVAGGSAGGAAGGRAGGVAGGSEGGDAGGSAGGVAGGSAGGAAGGSAGGAAGGSAGGAAGGSAGGAAGGSSGGTAGGSAFGCALPPLVSNQVIYVSPNGASSNDGQSPSVPVPTVSEGLARLTLSGRRTLALMPGVHLVAGLRFTTGTVSLVGVDASGARLCSSASFPRIDSTLPIGLEVAGGVISVEQLVIAAAAGTTTQRSSYGAFVSAGTVSLVDTTLEAGNGAPGSPPASDPAPAPPPTTCQGVADCANGAGGLNASSGAPSDGGAFNASGFLTGDGQRGGPGTPGSNGVQSVAPPDITTCINGCRTDTCRPGTFGCTVSSTVSLSAPPGRCGCGGAAGTPGLPGGGGGASIALLVTGGSVTMTSGRLKPANGGPGASGGAPSTPLNGTAGTPGAGVMCFDSQSGGACVRQTPPCNGTCVPGGMLRTLSSPPGGAGGRGGQSGNGGGGAGGPSYGWVRVGAGVATVSPQTSVLPGLGGPGADGARVGASANSLMWP